MLSPHKCTIYFCVLVLQWAIVYFGANLQRTSGINFMQVYFCIPRNENFCSSSKIASNGHQSEGQASTQYGQLGSQSRQRLIIKLLNTHTHSLTGWPHSGSICEGWGLTRLHNALEHLTNELTLADLLSICYLEVRPQCRSTGELPAGLPPRCTLANCNACYHCQCLCYYLF